jgi:hypothetical protein
MGPPEFRDNGPTQPPFSTPDVAAIEARRHRRSRFRRGLDLALAFGIVGELFGAELRFESLGRREHVLSHRLNVKALIDRQHVTQ